jgi:hypothetical protein
MHRFEEYEMLVISVYYDVPLHVFFVPVALIHEDKTGLADLAILNACKIATRNKISFKRFIIVSFFSESKN